jgi:hypothetical protein
MRCSLWLEKKYLHANLHVALSLIQAIGFPGAALPVVPRGRRGLATDVEDETLLTDPLGPGLVQVYELDATTASWVQLGDDIPFIKLGDTPSLFGYSLDMDDTGELLAVGAPGCADNRGAVATLFFNRITKEWNTYGDPIFGEVVGERLGTSVSLSAGGDVLAVGAPGIRSGAALVFYHDETTDDWEPLGQNLVGEASNDECGCDVSLSQDGFSIAVGCPGSDRAFPNAGAIFLYNTTSFSSDWTLYGSPIDGRGSGQECGASLELSYDGDTVVYGCPSTGASGPSGFVRVATYGRRTSRWLPVGDEIRGAAGGVSVGSSVTISRDSEVIAYSTDAGTSAGQVIALERNGDDWRQLGQTIVLTGDPVVPVALDLSLNGTTLLTGYIRLNDPGCGKGYRLVPAGPTTPPISQPSLSPVTRSPTLAPITAQPSRYVNSRLYIFVVCFFRKDTIRFPPPPC